MLQDPSGEYSYSGVCSALEMFLRLFMTRGDCNKGARDPVATCCLGEGFYNGRVQAKMSKVFLIRTSYFSFDDTIYSCVFRCNF